MKKQVLASLSIAIFAISANAQTARIFPVVTDSVRALYMSNLVGMSGGGSYTDYVIYKKVADTVYSSTVPVLMTNPMFWITIPNLTPDTDYIFANVIIKAGVHDTSGFETFTTPQLLPLSITNIVADTSVSPTRIRFHYNFGGGYEATVQSLVNSYSYFSPAITLEGAGDTSISMAGYDMHGATYSNNYLYASVVGTVTGIGADSFFAFADYTVPSITRPMVDSLSISFRSQDSLEFTANIQVGTLGYSVVWGTLYGPISGPERYLNIIYHDTTLNWWAAAPGALVPNHPYSFTAFAFNTAGSDSQVIATSTLQVPLDSIVNWYIYDSTTSSTYINVSATSDFNWWSDTGFVWIKYPDKNGAMQTTPTIGFVGTVSHNFFLQNLLAGPTVINATIYAEDNAGIDSQQISFVIASPPPPIIESAPQWGDLTSVNSYTLGTANIQQSIITNDTVQECFAIENVTNGGTDTVYGPSGITASGTVPSFQITGLLGGVTYTVTPIAISKTGNYTPGTSLTQYTIAPARPDFEDIIINGTTDHTVDFNIRANGEGTPTQLLVSIYQNSNLVKTFDTISAGTGYIDYEIMSDGLLQNTAGTINVTVISNYGSDSHQQPFTTAPTGISNIADTKQNPQFAIIGNILGQKMFQGNYNDAISFAQGKGLLFLIPCDKNGNILGQGKKITIQ